MPIGEYKSWDVFRFHMRNRRWWALCSQVDVEELRKEVRAEEFARLRAEKMTAETREELKEKVSKKQKKIYLFEKVRKL